MSFPGCKWTCRAKPFIYEARLQQAFVCLCIPRWLDLLLQGHHWRGGWRSARPPPAVLRAVRDPADGGRGRGRARLGVEGDCQMGQVRGGRGGGGHDNCHITVEYCPSHIASHDLVSTLTSYTSEAEHFMSYHLLNLGSEPVEQTPCVVPVHAQVLRLSLYWYRYSYCWATSARIQGQSITKPPLFRRNRLTGSGNPGFESYV